MRRVRRRASRREAQPPAGHQPALPSVLRALDDMPFRVDHARGAVDIGVPDDGGGVFASSVHLHDRPLGLDHALDELVLGLVVAIRLPVRDAGHPSLHRRSADGDELLRLPTQCLRQIANAAIRGDHDIPRPIAEVTRDRLGEVGFTVDMFEVGDAGDLVRTAVIDRHLEVALLQLLDDGEPRRCRPADHKRRLAHRLTSGLDPEPHDRRCLRRPSDAIVEGGGSRRRRVKARGFRADTQTSP